MPIGEAVGGISAFWVTAGQAGAIVGGVVAATVTGALLVSRGIDRVVRTYLQCMHARTSHASIVCPLTPTCMQEDPDAAEIAEAELAAASSTRRTRLKPEDVLKDSKQIEKQADK